MDIPDLQALGSLIYMNPIAVLAPRISILLPSISPMSKLSQGLMGSRKAQMEKMIQSILQEIKAIENQCRCELLLVLPAGSQELSRYLHQVFLPANQAGLIKIHLNHDQPAIYSQLLSQAADLAQGQVLLFCEAGEPWRSGFLKEIYEQSQDHDLICMGDGPAESSDWLRSLLSGECRIRATFAIKSKLYKVYGPLAQNRLLGSDHLELILRILSAKPALRFYWAGPHWIDTQENPFSFLENGIQSIKKVEGGWQISQEIISQFRLLRRLPLSHWMMTLQRLPILNRFGRKRHRRL